MAELKFSGRPGPIQTYFNPNIWTVVSTVPSAGPPSAPVVNQTTWIWCSIANVGTEDITGVTVSFYVCNPSTNPTPATSPLLGTSNASLAAGETKEVLCVTPWIPTWVNQGHECIVCEVSAPDDPAGASPNAPWDLSNRHIAQHNVTILQQAQDRPLSWLTQLTALGLANSQTIRVRIVPAPEDLFATALKAIGADHYVKNNITNKASFGVVSDYYCGDPFPDVAKISKQLACRELSPNQQQGVTALIHFPENIKADSTSAALFFVEQVDAKENVVGGVAVFAIAGPLIVRPVLPLATPIPMSIPYRPYSSDRRTGLMSVDGFFIANNGNQNINVETRNDGSASLQNLSLYLEGASDPNINISFSQPSVALSLPGASSKFRFLGDFTKAAPGVTIVSIIIQQTLVGGTIVTSRIIKKIFVTRVDFDPSSKIFTVNLPPQGQMNLTVKTAVVPSQNVCPCPCDGDKGTNTPTPILIEAGTMTWLPSPPYLGTHGPLPFNDPWWKIALLILAGIFGAASGGSVSVSGNSNSSGATEGTVTANGTFDETDPSVSCCGSVSSSNPSQQSGGGGGGGNLLISAILAVAAVASVAAAAKDDVDLHFRGQEQTVPSQGELTVSEAVTFDIDLKEPPSSGTPFKGSITWNYKRALDSGRVLEYGTTDDYDNPHYLKQYVVNVDGVHNSNGLYTYDRGKSGLYISATFTKPDGTLFTGSQLYVPAILWSEFGNIVGLELRDDGLNKPPNAGDGNAKPGSGDYSGTSALGRDFRAGNWYLFVFAQNANTVLEGTDPIQAAKTIGGFCLTNQLNFSFGSKPCELNHDAVITVV